METIDYSAEGKLKLSNCIVPIVTVLLIVLWTYASLSKLLDYQNFRLQLGKSPLLTGFEGMVAAGVPLLEICIAVLLAVKRTATLGLYASLALLSLFTAYLVVILNYSYYIPCSCGGILQGLSWKSHIMFNGCFLALAAAAVIFSTSQGAKGGAFSKC